MPRVNASGNVTFDGEPVPYGTVIFLNQESGNSSRCEIDGGYYESESDDGPNPGQTTILIVGKQTEDGDPMWGGSWTKQVVVGDTDYTEDFAITKDQVQPFTPDTKFVDE